MHSQHDHDQLTHEIDNIIHHYTNTDPDPTMIDDPAVVGEMALDALNMPLDDNHRQWATRIARDLMGDR